MKKEVKWNEQGALNNNLDAATLQMNTDIPKQHVKPKTDKSTKTIKQK